MSNTEFHFGKIRKVNLEGKTKEEFFQEKCQELGINELKAKTWYETLGWTDEYENYYLSREDIWEVFEHKEMDDQGYFKMLDNKDGTYTFMTSFYNGGTCLGEILEEEIQNL